MTDDNPWPQLPHDDPGEVTDPMPGAATPAEPTGDTRVDGALAELHRIDELPVSEHVAVYDEVHRRLQDALATVDEE